MNEFRRDLQFSHEAEDLPIWKQVYAEAFPGMIKMVSYRQNGEHQAAGIDRGVYLWNAKEILVDEKVRRKDYGDIALEFLSNDKTGALGWVCKPLRADYIAYAILDVGRCFLLPVIQLQTSWEKFGASWRERFGIRHAANPGYRTHFCPVPVNEVYCRIGGCLRVSFSPIAESSSCPER